MGSEHTPVGVKSWVWNHFGFRTTDGGAVVRDVAVCKEKGCQSEIIVKMQMHFCYFVVNVL